MAVLQQRIAAEFGRCIPIAELRRSQTVRGQSELVRLCAERKPELPPGVFAIQPSGTRKPIFWIHYSGVELARELGDEQPFFSVMLTAEDFALLGINPTLQSIATCLLEKILATRIDGPYAVGGFCLGGTLAHEIASQLRSTGQEVSLVVMLDTPTPWYVTPSNSLGRNLKYIRYLLQRTARLGLHTSLVYLREHLLESFARVTGKKPPQTEADAVQAMCEAALFEYKPGKYDGKVLLLLAGERPPHVSFQPGWQEVITGELCVQYLDGHHRDLAKERNVRTVAEAIASHLVLAAEDKPLSLLSEISDHSWCQE